MRFNATRLEELAARIARGVAEMTAASAGVLEAVARYDEAGGWDPAGGTSMSGWLAARYHLGWGTAAEWVRVARALRELPEIARAYRSGELSWDQLRAVTRFATRDTDTAWAERARVMSPARLYREARRQERVRREEAEADHRMRYLRLDWDDRKRFLYLEGCLGAEQGAALETALERRAERVVLEEGPLYDRAGARMADALLELATSGGSSEPAPATLVVHADAAVVSGSPPEGRLRVAETESGARLADEAVRRLACDARIEWVLERDGRAVGIGRRRRAVPRQVHRLLRHRDAGCRFPGCPRKKWVQAHHLVHWGEGGSTNLDNLVLLCGAHHRRIHEGGWRTSGHPAHDLRFHDPTGRPIRTRASPPMPEVRGRSSR